MFDRTDKGFWWDRPLTLVEGCTPVSPGCDHCWSAAMHHRFHYPGADNLSPDHYLTKKKSGSHGEAVFTSKIIFRPDRLDLPLKVKKSQVWAVWNDLFHEDVPFNFIEECLESFSFSRQHIFMILTKRAERMKVFFDWLLSVPGRNYLNVGNVWLGVTAENQEMANTRIPLLLHIPAAVRFVSVEPLLSKVDISPWLDKEIETGGPQGTIWGEPKLHCIICGGESGPHARPMHPGWARSLRDQCVAAQVPFFFKSWGEWLGFHPDHNGIVYTNDGTGETKYLMANGKKYNIQWSEDGDVIFARVGKKAAGRLLDGQEWLQVPEVRMVMSKQADWRG